MLKLQNTINLKKVYFIRISFLVLSCLPFLSGCETKQISPESQIFAGQEFFPLSANDEKTFEVYEINYTNFGSDTAHYFQKEKTFSISKEEEEETYYIQVLKGSSLDSSFSISEIYSIRLKNKQIIETRNNILHIIAVLPLSTGLKFDRNLYNSKKLEFTTVKALNENQVYTDFLGSHKFQNVLDLEMAQSTNTIEQINKHRVYQENKGLVYELDQDINQQPNSEPIGYKNLKIRIL